MLPKEDHLSSPPFLSSEADVLLCDCSSPSDSKGMCFVFTVAGDFNVPSVFFLSANHCPRFSVLSHFNISSAPILVSLGNN